MDRLRQDLRYALRTLRRRPGFLAVAVITLGLGVGASTAIFSLIDAALLRPLPFAESDRLIMVAGVAGPERDIRGGSYPEVVDWRSMNRTLDDLSVYDPTAVTLTGENGASRLNAEVVSPSYFSILRVDAARGRVFGAEAANPGAPRTAVIAHDLWRSRFGGDPDVVGRTVMLEGTAYEVIGVMPEGFGGLSFDSQVWLPFAAWYPGLIDYRGQRWLLGLGRMAPGLDRSAVQEDLNGVASRLEERFPELNHERGAMLIGMREFYLGDTRTLLWALLASVALLLVIACANVTNLQLVRATARGREFSLRYALGAVRARIAQQMVTEGVVLSLLGGVAGLLMAYWGIRGLLALVPANTLPAYVDPHLDLRAAAFGLGLATAAGVLFGLVPALRGAGGSLMRVLRDGARGTAPGTGRLRRPSLQQLLVVGEVAVALVTLVGAGLIVRSVLRQLDVDPGFRAEGVMVGAVDLPTTTYEAPQRVRFAESLVERVEALPGVRSAAVASTVPLRGSSASILELPERPGEGIRYYRYRVTPEYFETLGIPIVRGHGFEEANAGDARAVLVSQPMAERLWPGEDPIGRQLRIAAFDAPATVIGVAGPVHHRDITTDLRSPSRDPDVYVPYAQAPTGGISIIVRSDGGDPAALTPLIRRELDALDPTLPLFAVTTLEDLVAGETSTDRFAAYLLLLFGALAMALTAIGIYGVVAFLVGMRRREIAVRIAIGASAGSVRALVLRQGMRLVGAGLVVGLLGAFAVSRALAGVLFGVRATDPVTFGAVALFLLGVATVANYLPARHATRLDPQIALRGE